jgi:hypothetical protein
MLQRHHPQNKDDVEVEDDYDSSHLQQASCTCTYTHKRRYSHNRYHYHPRKTIRLTVTMILMCLIFVGCHCSTMTHATDVTEHHLIHMNVTTHDDANNRTDNDNTDAHSIQYDSINSNHQQQPPAKLLRGTTRHSYGNNNINNEFSDDDDDIEDDLDQYILDYHDIDIQNNRKLVTMIDRNKILQFQRNRNIINTTWIIVFNNNNNNNPSNIILTLLRKKIVSRLSLVLNAIVVKGITRNTLNWLLQQPDVLLIEEVRSG